MEVNSTVYFFACLIQSYWITTSLSHPVVAKWLKNLVWFWFRIGWKWDRESHLHPHCSFPHQNNQASHVLPPWSLKHSHACGIMYPQPRTNNSPFMCFIFKVVPSMDPFCLLWGRYTSESCFLFFNHVYKAKGFQKQIYPETGFMYTVKLSLTLLKGLNKLCHYKRSVALSKVYGKREEKCFKIQCAPVGILIKCLHNGPFEI